MDNFTHLGGNADDAVDSHRPSRAPGSTARAASSATAKMLAQMLDIVDYGVLLVHDGGHVGFANRCARAELQVGAALELAGGALHAPDADDAATLAAALDAALHRGTQRLLKLGGRGSPTMLASVLPLAQGDATGERNALVVLGKRAVCADLSADEFGRRHGVTSAELRVMKQLSAGCAAAEIARSQGVALSTVRTQISSLRGKTGADSILGLVRQVASLPPLASRVLTMS